MKPRDPEMLCFFSHCEFSPYRVRFAGLSAFHLLTIVTTVTVNLNTDPSHTHTDTALIFGLYFNKHSNRTVHVQEGWVAK